MVVDRTILTVLLIAGTVTAGNTKSKDGNRDYRSQYPSVQTMLMRSSSALPTSSVDTKLYAPLANANVGEGLTYLEFYGEENCGGGVTYSTGFRAGFCLPASDYVRPPFATDDDYPDSFPFQSLKISNVTGVCIIL